MTVAGIAIRLSMDIAHTELQREEPLNPKRRIQLEMEIQVLTMNLELLGLKDVPTTMF